jgi:neutral ceramidase
MAAKGWARWALIASVLLVTPAATCHVHVPPNPPGGGLTSALPSPLRAGAAKVALSLPAGTPLAGYGSAARRQLPPDADPFNGFTFFKPATGQMDLLFARALVMMNDTTKVGIVTVDSVGILSDLVDRIHARAVTLGATIPRENLVVSASHTHSGPGTQTKLKFWEMAGTDLLYAPMRDVFVNDCAQALFNAEQNLQLAKYGSGSDLLAGVTVNRRVGVSPTAMPTDVDKELGVIRIDKMDGTPLAVVWNFAIHGTAYGDSNLEFSPDIMGAVSAKVEADLGVPALFANGAEGDTAPDGHGATGVATLAPIIAAKIETIHAGIATNPQIALQCVSHVEPFGKATLDLSLNRLPAGSVDLDLATLLTVLNLGHVAFKMDKDWFENDFRFQAIRMNDTLIVPVPGEPIFVVGQAMKAEGKALGFRRVFIFGLSNGHMAYITDQAEYNVGGYEAVATFFGEHTADKVHAAAKTQMVMVKP